MVLLVQGDWNWVFGIFLLLKEGDGHSFLITICRYVHSLGRDPAFSHPKLSEETSQKAQENIHGRFFSGRLTENQWIFWIVCTLGSLTCVYICTFGVIDLTCTVLCSQLVSYWQLSMLSLYCIYVQVVHHILYTEVWFVSFSGM